MEETKRLFLIGMLIFVPAWFKKTFGEIPADHFIFLITQGNGESTKARIWRYSTL